MSYIEWGILGLFLVLIELFVSGVYLLWFGLAGIVMSIASYCGLLPASISMQVIAFSMLSCIFAGIGYSIYKKMETKFNATSAYKDLNDLASQYIGQVVTLTQDVVDGKSKVKAGDTVWLAYAEEGLKAGDKVVITGVEKGVIFVVSKQ